MNKLADFIRKTPAPMASQSIMEGLQIVTTFYDPNAESQHFAALDYTKPSINPLAPNQDREMFFPPSFSMNVSYAWESMTGDPVVRTCATSTTEWSAHLQSDPPMGEIPEGVPVTIVFPEVTVYDAPSGNPMTFTPDPIEVTYMTTMTAET